MPSKKRDFERAALSKGFVERRSGDHIFFRYTDKNGKISDLIHTKISHGSNGDISDSLLASMRKQMKFDNKGDLIKFIECTFTKEMYQKMIYDKYGEI